MIPVWRPIALSLIASAAACGGRRPIDPVIAAPLISQLPDGSSQPEFEGVWEAVLAWYRRHPEPTEGDLVRRTNALFGRGGGGTAPTALLLRMGPSPAPYSRAWILHLVSARLLEGLCAAPDPAQCAEHQVVTYVILEDPVVSGDRSTLVVLERGLDPSQCNGRGFSGFTNARFALRRADSAWRVIGRERGLAGSRPC